ncbi:MAG: pseudouridine synthase, partial [Gammaproteobacteria bacterium]
MTVSNEQNPTSRVEWVTVGPEQGGQRIDNFLTRHLKGVPKTLIYRILRKGEVRVNKGRIKPDYRVQAGDEIRIPPLRRSQTAKRPPPARSLDALHERILHEDERIIIINKPSGMAVHGGSGLSHGVIEAMRHWRQDLHYLELAHRLDRETSGCLILAKKRSALRQIHALLRDGAVEKR